jgi:uncharacterized C2H2 Zn-finger protein
MTIYKCERCHYTTDYKTHYVRHLQKQIDCPPTHSSTELSVLFEKLMKPKAFQCQHCSKSFAFKKNLTRHVSNEHPSNLTKRMTRIVDKYKDIFTSTSSKEKVKDMPDTVLAYIYLIREREFVRLNEQVYKHGKTRQKFPCNIINRLNDYKTGSELVMIKQVPEYLVDTIEQNITRTFKYCFERHEDGHEYFVGDPFKMMNIIDDIIREICFNNEERDDDESIEEDDESEEENEEESEEEGEEEHEENIEEDVRKV